METTQPNTQLALLSDAELRRIERVDSRRGRVNPAKVPARLVRTAAFAPKRRGLITDSRFRRLYVVTGHSAVLVSGRELGSQHRDLLYAVFRLTNRMVVVDDAGGLIGKQRLYEVRTTWRGLLRSMGLTEHVNNIAGLHLAFEDITIVVVTVFEPKAGVEWEIFEREVRERIGQGRVPLSNGGAGQMGNMLHSVSWTGLGLNDEVSVVYGSWTAEMIFQAKLVSLNAEVQFQLASDYAKSFWPYIDSFTDHSWVDEERLAALAGRDLWSEHEDGVTRAEFRRRTRLAFDDMVRAGGLRRWREEERGQGRRKTRRYHYERIGGVLLDMLARDVAPVAVTVSTSSTVSRSVYDEVRKVAPGWDPHYIEQQWRGQFANKGEPRYPEKALVGFARKLYERRGPPR